MFVLIVKIAVLVSVYFGLSLGSGDAASPDAVWEEHDISASSSSAKNNQKKYVIFNQDVFKNRTKGITKESALKYIDPDHEIYLPVPDGSYERFKIVESPVMESGLAIKFPNIKTYRGVGVDDPYATLRMDITPKGCHAQIRSLSGTFYIDPIKDREIHVVQNREALVENNHDFICSTKSRDEYSVPASKSAPRAPAKISNEKTTNGTEKRVLRLALAATGEYTDYHGGTKELALASIVTAVNRINQIYENDLSLSFLLVSNNIDIIYTDGATDPYSTSNFLSENQVNIDTVIGTDNYEIGHLFTSFAGGVAILNSVCSSISKAKGMTGSYSPENDSFWVDYFAHEIGHQLGAEHTFNGELASCESRSAPSAYEPGSGATIMGYAGICGSDDLQSNSYDHFHANTLEQIFNYVTAINCGIITDTGNTPPASDAGPDFVIPHLTPFILKGSATDPDGDNLSYSWEGWDLGDSQSLAEMDSTDNGYSPRFRCWMPTNLPYRIFPRLSDLLGDTTSVGEKLPEVDRFLKFKLVVRDNKSGAGGFDTDYMSVMVVTSAGPFKVTSPNSSVTWSNQEQTITWDVANTTLSPIDCSEVNILLSIDGGYSWPYTLAAATDNDGTETVNIPNVNTNAARIKIEAVDNIFFDVSDQNFTINRTSSDNGVLGFENESSIVNETNNNISIDIIRALGASGTVNIDYVFVDGSAINGVHYQAVSGTLTFVEGQLTNSINVAIINNEVYDVGLYFDLILMSPDGGAFLGAPAILRININDDEPRTQGKITLCNENNITILSSGEANPYPSVINVSGLEGVINKLTVDIKGFEHTYPNDADLLLVGSGGRSIHLMSDIGNSFSLQTGMNFTFSDSAASYMPYEGTPSSGTWKPTDYYDEFLEVLPTSESKPSGTELSIFNDISPNGEWRLYVYDDYLGDNGEITNGWCLNFEIDVIMKIKECSLIENNVDVKFNTTIPGTYGLLNSTNLISEAWITNQTFEVMSAGDITRTVTNVVDGTPIFFKINYNSTLD